MSFRSGISRAALERGGVKVQSGDLGSDLEGELASALHLAALPAPERECCLVPERKWACDFVWRAAMLVVEVEGGTQSGKSRHSKGKGFAEDCRKYAELTLLGYRVIRVTGEHIASGEAVAWIERALEQRGAKPALNSSDETLLGVAELLEADFVRVCAASNTRASWAGYLASEYRRARVSLEFIVDFRRRHAEESES